MNTNHTDGVSLVIPVQGLGTALITLMDAWTSTLQKMKTLHEVVLVMDQPTDADKQTVESLQSKYSSLKIVSLQEKRGIGAALRASIPECSFPLVAHLVPNYPYTPGDLAVFLQRINHTDERLGQQPMLVAGCRTGRPVPAVWKAIGFVYRGFLRVVLGMPTDPLPGWLGLREHLRAWRVWLVYGVPFQDVNCGLRLYRKSLFDRFPIQSDGDFVHVEIAAKCTFITAIVDEVPLTASPEDIPPSDWRDSGKVFRKPIFHPLAKPVAAAPSVEV